MFAISRHVTHVRHTSIDHICCFLNIQFIFCNKYNIFIKYILHSVVYFRNGSHRYNYKSFLDICGVVSMIPEFNKKKKFLQFESQTPSPPSVFGIPPFSIGLLSIFYSKPQRNLRIFIICRSRRASKFASPHLSYFVAILRHYSFDNTCCPNTVSTSSLLLTRSFVPLFFPSFQFSLFFAVRISTDNFQVPCIIVGTQ